MATNGAKQPLFWGILGGVVIADVVTKLLVVAHLGRAPLYLAGQWLSLRLVYNQGAAFGIHVGAYSRIVFTGLALLALIVLGAMVRETRPRQLPRLIALALVCGGAVGNLVDRVRSGRGVVDFIDVWIGSFHWPTFNVADIAICVGVGLMAVDMLTAHRTSAAAAASA